MTRDGSYPLQAEKSRCLCGAFPVMEWENWGKAHRVVCTNCRRGSDLPFIYRNSLNCGSGGVYSSTREMALDRWEADLQPKESI